MCTAIARFGKDFTFGRNMDLDYDFGGDILVTPRNFPFSFLFSPKSNEQFLEYLPTKIP